jgi:hypothetical protein
MRYLKEFSNLAILALVFFPIQNAGAWGQFKGGHHPDYNPHFVRHDPVVVHNTYVRGGGGGCIGCGVGAAAVAGLLGGAILGATLAGGGAAPPPMVVEQPPPQVILQAPPPGTPVAVLPPGCASMNVNGANYFQCGQTWYQPYVGGNGVYYVAIPTP